MGAIMGQLGEALFSKSRRAVLSILYGQPDRAFYLREIADKAGVGMGQIQRELRRLSDSGILRRFEKGRHIFFQAEKGRHIFFQADETCPIYAELRSLVTKSFGVIDVLRKALADLSPKIALAFVYGSVVRGEERGGSDVDVFVIGDSSFREVAGAVTEAQASLGREINVTVYPEKELVEKVSKGHHFLSSVLNREKKLFIIGNEHELDALLDQQVDTRTRDLEGGSLGSARDR